MSESEPHKPLRKTRLFLKEVAIIVLGVGIALAAQQAVETWREYRQYHDARQAMIDELSGNLSNIRSRQKYVACTMQRIQDIGAILDSAEAGKPFTAPSWIGDAISFRVRFTAENEAQKSALFTSAEQRSFGSPYSYFHSLDLEQDRERLAWGRLRMLAGKNHLSPEMIQSLRDALADARYENYRIDYLTRWTEAWGKQIGLTQRRVPTMFFAQHPHCVPMNTPLAEAERVTALIPPPNL